jgi:MYXO-CTERM domain-containing protein
MRAAKLVLAQALLATAAFATQTSPIVVSPSHVSIKPATSLTLSVQTAATGSTGQFALSVQGLPSSMGASFNPASIQMGQRSTLTLSADDHAVSGDFNYTVVATGQSTTYQGVASITIDNGSSGCPAGYHAEGGYCVPNTGGCSSGANAAPWAALLAMAAFGLRLRRRA